MEKELVKLSEMTPGEEGIVSGFGPGSRDYRRKLLSFGLTKGTSLSLVKSAPLGDPVEIEVRGFRLSLRKAEAAVLEIRRQK